MGRDSKRKWTECLTKNEAAELARINTQIKAMVKKASKARKLRNAIQNRASVRAGKRHIKKRDL